MSARATITCLPIVTTTNIGLAAKREAAHYDAPYTSILNAEFSG